MNQFNNQPHLLAPNATPSHAGWPIKPCLAVLLVVLAATAGAQTTQPATPTFTEAGNAECAAIKKKAYERHAIRVALLKESGESDQIPAVEKNRDERVERLCALAFQTAADEERAAADKQATAAILQGVALKEERAAADKQAASADRQATAAILQGVALKEERAAADRQAAAADRQAAATYREMADVLQKLEKNPASRADLDRLPILYAKLAAQATESEKKNALPIIANVMRKLGVKVPGD